MRDIRDYDKIKQAIESGEELVPAELVHRILDGDSPIKAWREHRGQTQQQLATTAGISKGYLSQLESGDREGSVKVLSAIATALAVDLDDLVSERR